MTLAFLIPEMWRLTWSRAPVSGFAVNMIPGCIREHELLHHHSNADILRTDTIPSTVVNRSCRPQRGPAAFHCTENHRLSSDVQIRILLTGKRELAQGFGGTGGTHGNCWIRLSELGIRCADRL